MIVALKLCRSNALQIDKPFGSGPVLFLLGPELRVRLTLLLCIALHADENSLIMLGSAWSLGGHVMLRYVVLVHGKVTKSIKSWFFLDAAMPQLY